MRLQLQQFISLTANAFLDIIRQPIVLLLTVTSIVLTSILPLVSVFMFGEEARLVQDGAFAFQFVIGLLLAGAAASATLYREISRGTAAMALCKPVSRSLFFLAKYVGVLLALVLFSLLSMITILLSVRMPLPGLNTDWRVGALLYSAIPAAFVLAGIANYFMKRPFISQAFAFLTPCLAVAFVAAAWPSAGERFGALMEWRLLPAGVLISLALAVFAAIALSLSTRLPPVFTLATCGILFLLGLLSDYLFGRAAENSLLAAAIHGLLPNWQDFWLVDALAAGGVIAWSYVAGAVVYAMLLIAGILCFGLVSFRNVEIQ
jgi:ABC-type transport system involved in multi-copper enzyme maturation permease subunit